MNEIFIDEYQERFALIIGINVYKNANNLEYAENDAKEVSKILKEKYNYKPENITLLLNEQATKQNIMNVYYKYINETGNNDSLLVYYAGHGTTTIGHNGPTGFLIPYDGNEINWFSLIRWDEFSRVAEMIKAKHIFFVMDACYSGLAITRSSNFGSKRFLRDMLKRYSRQVLTAGKGDETVSDGNGPLPGHSIFTGFFIEAINGKAKTDSGIITANSIMSYVYNKVANNTYSRQTPHYGFIAGDGDFILNIEDLPQNNEEGKDNDILIEVPTPVEINVMSNKNKIENEIKELLSDSKNEIKIYDLVNQELRTVIARLSEDNLSLNNTDTNYFKNIILKYEEILENLIIIVVLLIYYGDTKYLKLIKKILLRLTPTKLNSGLRNTNYLYYPVFLLYYFIILTSLETENITILNEVINITNDNLTGSHKNTKYVLVNIIDNMCYTMDNFAIFNLEKHYKYPMSEYLFKRLQPIMDDLLFLGDDYEQRFNDTEILISVIYALDNYENEKTHVWGPIGRFGYRLDYNQHNLEKLSINKILVKLDIYNNLDKNKEEFITKYNELLSKSYF